MNGERRVCPTCGASKALEDFPRNRSKKSGRDSQCRKCSGERHKRHHLNNLEKHHKKSAEWSRRNRALINLREAEKRRQDPGPERAKVRKYQAAHPERVAITRRKRYRNNPEKWKEYVQKRRASKASAPVNDFTAEQWRVMQEMYGHRCAYCGRHLPGNLTQDHITAISKGGSHTYTNIVPACLKCNCKKGNRRVPLPVQPCLLIPVA